MAGDLRLVLRITGDASGLKAEVVGAKREVEGLGQSAESAGRTGSGGLEAMAAAAGRVAATAASFATLGAAVLAVARAGDQATASFGRLTLAAGSAEAAADAYERLYQLSLQTGVSVKESADAFGRFAIAAREAGATQAQVLSIVQLMQQAGAVAGASAQETASATMQLGQALASGRLQGDELRSILEAMPNVAEALAKELGVGVGELRKMGEEGKLTAGVVIPALERAAAAVSAQFRELPPSMERGMATLRVATTQLLADFDKAVGLSRTIAGALEAAAAAANRVRLAGGLGAPAEQATYDGQQAAARVAELRRLIAADEAQLAPREIDGIRVAVPSGTRAAVEKRLQERREALAAAEAEEEAANARLDNAERDRLARGLADREAASARQRENERRTAETALNELRDRLFKERVIRREAAEDEARVRAALAAGATTQADADRDIAAIGARMREELAKLAPQARETAAAVTSMSDALAAQAARADELADSLRTPMERYSEAVAEATRLNALWHASIDREVRVGISDETLQRALARARAELARATAAEDRARPRTAAEEETARQAKAFEDLGRLGERAFDRVGSAITAALAQGQLDFRRLEQVGLAVASELTQAFMQLAVINPIKNAVGLGSGGGATLTDLVGRLFGGGGGGLTAYGGVSPAGAIQPGQAYVPGISVGLHEGGIVGREATFLRAVPPEIFSTAPRYHAGGFVGPDEQPAILRRGEGVFTPEQMAALGPAGGAYTFAPTVHFHGDAGRAEDRDALLARMQGMWRADLAAFAPGVVSAAQAAIAGDVRRRGATLALGIRG